MAQEGMDGTIQQPWMPPGAQQPGPALLGVPSTAENHHADTGATVRNEFPFMYLSLQILTGLPKKEVPQKRFYSLFKNAMTLFHKVLRGQSPVNLELQRKAQTQISEEERDPTHTHMGLHSLQKFTGGIPGP